MVHDFKNYPELTNRQMQVYYFESPHKQLTEDFVGKVVKVTDGDTIRVTMDERDFDFPIRLVDIAAPELDEGGEESQRWLAAEILGEKVEVKINPRMRVGKWGRLLGEVFFRGMSMSDESMRRGHSIPFEERKSGLLPNFTAELEAVWR